MKNPRIVKNKAKSLKTKWQIWRKGQNKWKLKQRMTQARTHKLMMEKSSLNNKENLLRRESKIIPVIIHKKTNFPKMTSNQMKWLPTIVINRIRIINPKTIAKLKKLSRSTSKWNWTRSRSLSTVRFRLIHPNRM